MERALSEMEDRQFRPANEADTDNVRGELDRVVLEDVLGAPPRVTKAWGKLVKLWCGEPSVHGGKRSRWTPTGN